MLQRMPVAERFFLAADAGRTGQRFCSYYPAQGSTVQGAILYIHPFAEEMNKSRRMAALQARAFSQAGYSVLQIDLLGCGDSSGDFADASWGEWVQDVLQGCRWLQDRTQAPLWLWGLRAGCLLAVEAAAKLQTRCDFLFWAPTSAGKILLQQFMRLKAANEMLSGNAKGIVDGLRQQLAAGKPVDIAGYSLSPDLATGLDQAKLAPPNPAHRSARPGRLEWFDLSTRDDAELSPVSSKIVAQWREAGFAVDSRIVVGPSFWQTTEIEDAPALIQATTRALRTEHSLVAA